MVGGRTCSGEDGALWICLLPSSSLSKLQLATWGRFSANTVPITILPQCLWRNTAHSTGREGVCAVVSALTLAPAWKLVTLGPPAQEGEGDRSDVPQDNGTLEANQAEGMCGLLLHPMERDGS